ncbi:MAG: hypothetical protein EOP55_22470 [Sphingobacteriales bacterium]|nr:MAG: hypothetical protein EOP55_22470 [Sphingobacteriales bacterium]
MANGRTNTSQISVLIFLSACSLYSSAGRKQFEERAPANVVQGSALVACHDAGSAETWLKREFPPADVALVEMNPDYEVYSRTLEGGQVEVSVHTANPTTEGTASRICTYQFSSASEWRLQKVSFLTMLAENPPLSE